MKIFLGGSRWQQNQPITPPNEKACFFQKGPTRAKPGQLFEIFLGGGSSRQLEVAVAHILHLEALEEQPNDSPPLMRKFNWSQI